MPYQDMDPFSEPSSAPSSSPRPKPRPDPEPTYEVTPKVWNYQSDSNDNYESPSPSVGRGTVYESPNERNDYLAQIIQQQQSNDNYGVVPPPSSNEVASAQYWMNQNQQPVYNSNDLTSDYVQYFPPNLRDPLLVGTQYDRSVPHALVDNIVGLNDNYYSAGEGIGDYAREHPVGFAKDMALGLGNMLYDLVTSPIDTARAYGNSIYDAYTRDPSSTNADQRIADLLTVGSIVPTTKAAQIGGRAINNTKVAKGLRGELAADYFGPDGPDIPPNMGGFMVPDHPIDKARLKILYKESKDLGLTDNQIQEKTGIKRYASYDVDGNLISEVFGETIPVDSLDVSNIPYTVKTPEGSLRDFAGYYDPSKKEIVISTAYAKNPKLLNEIVRHESEHKFQDVAGLIADKYGSGGPRYQFGNQEEILRNNRKIVSQLNDEIKAAKAAGNVENVAKLTEMKNEVLANSEAVKNVDVYAGYMNSPIEVGARQAEGVPVTTYDPTVTAAELLDKGINPKSFPVRVADALNRVIFPTHKGLAKFREFGPTVGDTKLFSGIAEALLPLANANTPRVVSTRGNVSYPYLTPNKRGGDVFQASPSQRSVADDIQAMIDSLNKKAPVVEFENRKGQMISGGLSGQALENALDNLARNLGIERPD